MTTTYVALLRGINVGGKNRLPMKDLLDLFGALGHPEARAYIQSGNVIVSADPATAAPLPAALTQGLAERFGLRVPVVLRSAAQMEEIMSGNPFLTGGADPEMLHVLFLAAPPDAGNVERLDPRRSPPDEFVVRGQEVYLRLPGGAARTKLTTAYFDAMLATTSTARNWRTVASLWALMGG